ncbi:MAG: transposase, partial [Planctomycetota bacterium]
MRSEKLVEDWMSMLAEFSPCFTKPGQRRFAALLSGTLLSERRPLVTEIVTALGLQDHWRAMEAFIEEGSWPLEEVERRLAKLVARSGRWGRRRISSAQGHAPLGRQLWAVDDLKVLKAGRK